MGDIYDHKEIEKKILEFWDKNKIYKFDIKKGEPFSIDTPPPTVSGKMHIGHAFSYSQQDFVARYKRMKENVFYPFGTDDNGLPTEKLIEKIKNVKSKKMSRADFIKLCLETLKEITPEFIQDWKNLGISADYDLYYSTINENSRRISQEYFIDLYKKNLIYKASFPTIWCPECQTPIAQAELEDKEKDSQFVFIKARLEDNSTITYATTRPELLYACVCISFHKDDKRYKMLIGKKAKIPISNKWVPIITDEFAKMDFGTGAVYWCPYGDKKDVEFLARHPEFNPTPLIEKDGTLNKNAKEYYGLKINEARKKIIEDLKIIGAIEKIEPIHHVANTHDKCGTEIEFITTEQWFIKILDKKNQLIKQGNKIKWHPEYMRKRYENWINGLEWDWIISRERHFGIPIPLWECKDCNNIIIPNKKELPIDPLEIKRLCPKCKKYAKAEEKVLDTWTTSSLTPQITSYLSKNKIEIPYSLRPQAHDIIRTWAFYTIIRSLYHENKIPWKEIMISGFVTLNGQKMSKSKGNIIQPQIILEKYGADALRFWAASSKLGEDLDYQEKDIITGKKTINKLINASKFIFMNLNNYKPNKKTKLELIDKLFLNKLNNLIIETTENFEKYEYSKAKLEIEKFFWNDFTSNYIEIVKKRIYNETGDRKTSARYTLYHSLLTILKLIAPIMPFITEEIYQKYYKENEKTESVHLTKWPENKKTENSDILDLFIDILSKIRQEKSLKQKPMNSEIILTITKENKLKLKKIIKDLQEVSNAKEIKEGKFKVDFV
ncbi:MAG: valine--tRNA ligase [Nanoarchaeota archaeon]